MRRGEKDRKGKNLSGRWKEEKMRRKDGKREEKMEREKKDERPNIYV